MKLIHYLNGEFVPEEKLLISPRDLGYMRGYAVFDFFRTYNGHKPFMFDYHIERFFNSAKMIGLSLPWTKEEIKSVITKTLEKNDMSKEFVMRIIASGGVSTLQMSNTSPTLVVMVDEAINFPKSIYEKGINVSTLEHKRYSPASKTTHYTEAFQHMEKMHAEGSGEILYVHDNCILEGAFSNFFCVINAKLVTAKNGVLPGITRLVVIEKLNLKVPVEVRDLKYQELDSATEAFISVSGKRIVPVVKVGDKSIGNGKVGPITKEVISKFDTFVASGKW